MRLLAQLFNNKLYRWIWLHPSLRMSNFHLSSSLKLFYPFGVLDEKIAEESLFDFILFSNGLPTNDTNWSYYY